MRPRDREKRQSAGEREVAGEEVRLEMLKENKNPTLRMWGIIRILIIVMSFFYFPF